MTFRTVDWQPETWALLGLFGVFLLVGVLLGIVALARTLVPQNGARRVLDERLARGEISPDEYRERLGVLGVGPSRSRALGPLAIALIAAGLVGSIVVAAVGPLSGGGLFHHMSGGMGMMMGTGETQRFAPAPASGAREVRIEGVEFGFHPNRVDVRTGETVNIVFANRGHMFHTLTIGELGFDLRANGGDSIAGALRVDRAGTYSFICAVSGHAEAGMRGAIVVTG